MSEVIHLEPQDFVGDAEMLVSGVMSEPYIAEWARVSPTPNLVVTLDLRLVWANARALALLDQREDLALVHGQVMLNDAGRTEALRRALQSSSTAPVAWLYPRRAAGAYFVIRIERLEPLGLEPGAALTLHSPASQTYLWSDIGEVFGLTPAEVGVVKRLIDGHSAERVAAHLGVSLETVRTHIKRIYAKLGIRSREELFAGVLPFALR